MGAQPMCICVFIAHVMYTMLYVMSSVGVCTAMYYNVITEFGTITHYITVLVKNIVWLQ